MTKINDTMTSVAYQRALAKLGLTTYSAPEHLGISLRQSMRYASGEHAVAPPIALLLRMYLKHGLPEGGK